MPCSSRRVVGTVAYVRRVRTEPDEKIAPAGGRWRRAALGVMLTGYQCVF